MGTFAAAEEYSYSAEAVLNGDPAPTCSGDRYASPLLQVSAITKTFPGVQALRGVNLTCRPGSVHALVGENGAGKSTLVSIITGAQRPDSGAMTWCGKQYEPRSPRDSLEAGIAAVYQELTVLPHLSVTDNVLLGQEMTRRAGILDRRAERERVNEALSDLAVSGIHLAAEAGTLSVAQQQLIEIARALMRDARLLILDEPSAVLAGQELDNLFRVIKRLKENGVAVLYISHRLNEVTAIADEVTVMRDGARVSTGMVARYDTARIIRDMVGRDVQAMSRENRPSQDRVALQVRKMVLPGTEPDGLSFDIHAGEVVGLGGLIGSGRSRVLRALAGLESPRSGVVTVNGHQIRRLNLRASIRNGIALVPEERKTYGLVLDLPVAGNITLPLLSRISRFSVLRRQSEYKIASQSMRLLNMKVASPWQATRELSGGTQQKVVLARWMQTEPTILLLDEPTRGIDVGAKAEIYDIIHKLTASGIAILLVSSELPELIGLSDRILVMRSGRIVGELSRAKATEEAVISLALGHEQEAVEP